MVHDTATSQMVLNITNGKTPAGKAVCDAEGNNIPMTYARKNSLAEVAMSGSYNDLKDKPTVSFPVTSVNGQVGNVDITRQDIGLENVDNVRQYSAINPPPGSYDLVIETQEEFEAFCAELDAGACTARTVLIIGGAAPYTRSATGLHLPETLVRLDCANGATIKITDFAPGDANMAAVWYTEQPDDSEISGLTVQFELTRGYTAEAVGFYNCKNLTRCFSGALYGGYAFKRCTALTGCAATGGQLANGFLECMRLTECDANISGGGAPLGALYGFNACEELVNCSGSVTASNMASRAFYSCTGLVNCIGSGTSSGGKEGHAFYDCSVCSGCRQKPESASTTATWGGTNEDVDPNTCPEYVDPNALPTTEGQNGKVLGVRADDYALLTLIYDVVIRTQEEFDAFFDTLPDSGAEAAGTCTARSVLIIGNGSKYVRGDGKGKGMHLPDTLYRLDGINGAVLSIQNFQDVTNDYYQGIWYDRLPSDNMHSISHIHLEVSARGGGSGGTRCCFSKCTNLTGCSATISNGIAFESCVNLTDCRGELPSATLSSRSSMAAFAYCRNLVNCYGKATNGYGNGILSAFYSCKALVNCSGVAQGDYESFAGYTFYSCDMCSSCYQEENNKSTTGTWNGCTHVDRDTCPEYTG